MMVDSSLDCGDTQVSPPPLSTTKYQAIHPQQPTINPSVPKQKSLVIKSTPSIREVDERVVFNNRQTLLCCSSFHAEQNTTQHLVLVYSNSNTRIHTHSLLYVANIVADRSMDGRMDRWLALIVFYVLKMFITLCWLVFFFFVGKKK